MKLIKSLYILHNVGNLFIITYTILFSCFQLFGAVITGIATWLKVDQKFWEIQTGLDLQQFSSATTILIIAGVVIMVIGFLGCYGAIAETLWMLILVSKS